MGTEEHLYYLALKRKEILTRAAVWINLETWQVELTSHKKTDAV